MTLIAKKYLGNLSQNTELENKLNQAKHNNKYLEVKLEESDSSKGRILTTSLSGVAIGIIKSRELLLKSGDILETENNDLVLINIKEEQSMVLSFTDSNYNPYDLVKLGHILGNNHYPLKIQEDKIYVRLISNPKVLEKIIQQLNINGLTIGYINQSVNYQLDDMTHDHFHNG